MAPVPFAVAVDPYPDNLPFDTNRFPRTIHRNGQSIWNGTDDAFLGGYRTEEDPLVVRTLGVFHDPGQFVQTEHFRRMRAVAPAARLAEPARAGRWPR